MKVTSLAGVLFLLIVQCRAIQAAPAPADRPTVSLVDATTIGDGAGSSATIGRDGNAFRLTFQPADWPNVMWRAPQAKPWDWSAAEAMVIDLANPDPQPLQLSVRIDDAPEADGIRHCRSTTFDLPGKASGLYVVPLRDAGGADDRGMRGAPPLLPGGAMQLGAATGAIELTHIHAFQLFMHSPAGPRSIRVHSIRLAEPKGDRYAGLLDRFGQYTGADWPGKVRSDSDLKKRDSEEREALKAGAAPSGLDAYGGALGGLPSRATGFFRAEKLAGRWTLVTPNGYPFISIGVDVVQPRSETLVQTRESMFTWLPEPESPLAAHFSQVANIHRGPVKGGRAFDFYGANLERKYGAAYEAAWTERTLDRLRAWSFNTIGNWSSEPLEAAGRMPYTATLGVGGAFARVPSGADLWGEMPDPFDPEFARAAEASLGAAADRRKADQSCIGYFVDNELSWAGWDDAGRYALVRGVFSTGPAQPAKRALVGNLLAKYGTVEKLNAAWGTTFASWDEVRKPFKEPSSVTPALKADESAFLSVYAATYFAIVRSTLRKHDPNHLYLGCRFAAWTPETVKEAALACDVVSFNIYSRTLDPSKWAFTDTLAAPCIVGEFHFGALDRGMFHPGLVQASDQRERGRFYAEYMRSVAARPAFVGAHWFQYVDEPTTGRYFDGENYNIGLVSITDTPYPELTAAATAANASALGWHMAD
ncbi:MAG TPA: beta-galactosidase [Armatimonadota bacterium]|jgi:hypothetical protein